MKAVSARITDGLHIGSKAFSCDNSGARIVRITGVKRGKSRHGRQVSAKLGDWVKVSVREGNPEMIGIVFDAVIVRQKKPWRRLIGERICFSDNAVVLIKDEKGNPKGTQIKGAIAREISERWPNISKLARIVV